MSYLIYQYNDFINVRKKVKSCHMYVFTIKMVFMDIFDRFDRLFAIVWVSFCYNDQIHVLQHGNKERLDHILLAHAGHSLNAIKKCITCD